MRLRSGPGEQFRNALQGFIGAGVVNPAVLLNQRDACKSDWKENNAFRLALRRQGLAGQFP
jgi:hypothetical protein